MGTTTLLPPISVPSPLSADTIGATTSDTSSNGYAAVSTDTTRRAWSSGSTRPRRAVLAAPWISACSFAFIPWHPAPLRWASASSGFSIPPSSETSQVRRHSRSRRITSPSGIPRVFRCTYLRTVWSISGFSGSATAINGCSSPLRYPEPASRLLCP
jgi:hypothetical protein